MIKNVASREVLAAMCVQPPVKHISCLLCMALTIATSEKDTRPYIKFDKAYDGALFPSQTRRLTGLAH